MPTQKEIESIKETTQNFNVKIENILKRIKSYKNEIQERFVKLNNYLNFLKLTVNEKILKDFNYLNFDYYNYKNFKYLSNYLNTEEILQNDNFIKYLAFGKYSDKIKQENKEDITQSYNITLEKKKKKDDNKIDYLEELIYVKDNLFIQFDNLREITIKLFEFKYKSFNHILSYSFNDSGKLRSIKPTKYNNNILINFDNKKNIKIIEYNLDNKTMSLIKNQIKTSKSLSDRFFISYIDDKKGNIITSDMNDLILWSKYKKSYKEMKKINGKYDTLFNIYDTIFCGKSWFFIYFFDIEYFKVINKIYIKNDFEIIGSINDNIFIWTEKINNLLIIDLKYFEIVQKIALNNNFNFLKIQKNYLISFSKKTDNLMSIQKYYFDSKVKQFEKKNISIVEVDSNRLNNNIIITNNDYFIITNNSNLLVFNI